jgi:hypothetical protein
MDHMPDRYASSADTNAMVARTAPAVLALLGDGMARNRKAIVAALAERHGKDDVVRTLMRLTVTGRVTDVDHKYSLVPATAPDEAVSAVVDNDVIVGPVSPGAKLVADEARDRNEG